MMREDPVDDHFEAEEKSKVKPRLRGWGNLIKLDVNISTVFEGDSHNCFWGDSHFEEH